MGCFIYLGKGWKALDTKGSVLKGTQAEILSEETVLVNPFLDPDLRSMSRASFIHGAFIFPVSASVCLPAV